MKSYVVAKPLPRLKGEVPATAGGEVTFPNRYVTDNTTSRATLIYGCASRMATHTTRCASENAVFAPHSNIWWGVNKFCRILNEPPNGFGGEHPRGENSYPKHIPFAETRNNIDNIVRGVITLQYAIKPLALGESSGLKHLKQLPINIRSPARSLQCSIRTGRRRTAFLCSFLFPKRKRVPLVPTPVHQTACILRRSRGFSK